MEWLTTNLSDIVYFDLAHPHWEYPLEQKKSDLVILFCSWFMNIKENPNSGQSDLQPVHPCVNPGLDPTTLLPPRVKEFDHKKSTVDWKLHERYRPSSPV